MEDTEIIRQFAKQLEELALLFAEFAWQCEYEAIVLEQNIQRLQAEL